MEDDSLSSERNIFTATHSVFLHQIDRGALPSTMRGFFPTYRMGIGKNSDMVGKIPPWRWDMVGVHEGIINQVILFIYYLYIWELTPTLSSILCTPMLFSYYIYVLYVYAVMV
jgi:hypothetical protein